MTTARHSGEAPEAVSDVAEGAQPSARRLSGRQAMTLQGVDRRATEELQRAEGRAPTGYVCRAYGADGLDPRWYHMVLDSTALDLLDCVEQIAAAVHARLRQPRPSPPI